MISPLRALPLVALGWLTACSQPSAAAIAGGRAAREGSPGPADDASKLCGPVLAHNRRLLAASDASKPEGEVDFEKACYPVRGGAWALRLLEWKKGNFIDVEGRFELVYAPRGGEFEAAPLPPDFDRLHQGIGRAEVEPPRFFDFDGDGEPELFLHRTGRQHEGPSNDAGLLLTARGGRPRPMPGAPRDVEALEDVDHDGRPDLVYHPYAAVRVSCAGFDYSSFGPAFVAHSRPGGAFSTDDAVARAFAAPACPAWPRPDAEVEVDESDSPPAPPELCARMQGASEAEALAVLAGVCQRAPSYEEACRAGSGYCEDYEERAADLKRAPPLTLRDGPR